jgi:mycofactocin precursor
MDASGTLCQYFGMTTTATEPALADEATTTTDDEVLAEVLVEEISIDGMCGVY